ncbi:bifunctional 2-polyprenyl-6-hydroxyphenol methylase/3-demethylubiquinol 3-O-methyltransferase UbiG [Phenylobacterium sp.]|uniref:class I SAM-dependent methyltransferase n=1 Tax=Phenylobacterium sp. TaxID=1871053 RepID=UPI00271F5D10|nr:class I SAM-dependent methyltransferase [Phenylobacterium sp.]MDO8801631.1 class I SAM-dependent methyltransferase [Phenylobacterium sp.]
MTTDVTAYLSYQEWKGWGHDRFMRPTIGDLNYFDAELHGLDVTAGAVLDIGFGNGEMLAWAQLAGAPSIYGTEIDDAALSAAAERGIQTLPLDPASWPAVLDGQFVLVSAFDLLEHLTREQALDLLERVGRLLKPGGWFVARFPNGQSPFGRAYQHGDVTHLSTLSGPLIGQLIRGLPFEMLRYGDPVRPTEGSLLSRVGRAGRDLLRLGFEFAIRRMYRVNVPFDPNLVVVLRRIEDKE